MIERESTKQNQGKKTQPSQTEAKLTNKADLGNYIKDEQMIKVLAARGVTKLFPIQYETYNYIYEGEDIIAKDRTGSGKTLAFALPIIMRMRKEGKFRGKCHPRFLVVLPTRELAIQVKEEFKSLRLKIKDDFQVGAVYGGSGIQQQISQLSRGVDIVVGTPGRIIDLLERGALYFQFIEVVCLDEADEMLNIGFKQDIQTIFKFITRDVKQKPQCLMFSATIPEWIWKMSSLYQSKNCKFIDMIKDGLTKTSKTVEHYCMHTGYTDKEDYLGPLIDYILGKEGGKIIVFCETKREVDRIGNSGMIPGTVGMLHGDYKQFERERVFQHFKSGKVDCLIATNVAARGLDFPQIDLIIQMQPPSTTDAYIHRSGRTGRCGKTGICVTFYNNKEEYLMERIEREAKIVFDHLNPSQLPPIVRTERSLVFNNTSSNSWISSNNRVQSSSGSSRQYSSNSTGGYGGQRGGGYDYKKYADPNEFTIEKGKYFNSRQN